MSELKEHIFSDIDEVFPNGYCGPLPSHEARHYYLKSEADKVFAELEERIADGDRDFEMANNQNERLLKIVRRQKYKRCLAMAKMCTELAERYQAEYDAEEGFGDGWLKWIRWARKWHNRWLDIAEKFKEAK